MLIFQDYGILNLLSVTNTSCLVKQEALKSPHVTERSRDRDTSQVAERWKSFRGWFEFEAEEKTKLERWKIIKELKMDHLAEGKASKPRSDLFDFSEKLN